MSVIGRLSRSRRPNSKADTLLWYLRYIKTTRNYTIRHPSSSDYYGTSSPPCDRQRQYIIRGLLGETNDLGRRCSFESLKIWLAEWEYPPLGTRSFSQFRIPTYSKVSPSKSSDNLLLLTKSLGSPAPFLKKPVIKVCMESPSACPGGCGLDPTVRSRRQTTAVAIGPVHTVRDDVMSGKAKEKNLWSRNERSACKHTISGRFPTTRLKRETRQMHRAVGHPTTRKYRHFQRVVRVKRVTSLFAFE